MARPRRRPAPVGASPTTGATPRPARPRRRRPTWRCGPASRWDHVLGPLLALGPDELDRRQRAADRLMVAEGAERRPPRRRRRHGAARGASTSCPLVIDAAEWADLAPGLAAAGRAAAAVSPTSTGPAGCCARASCRSRRWPGTPARWLACGRRPRRLRLTRGRRRRRARRRRAGPGSSADLTDVPSGDGHALLARSDQRPRAARRAHPSVGLVAPPGATRPPCGPTLATAAPPDASQPPHRRRDRVARRPGLRRGLVPRHPPRLQPGRAGRPGRARRPGVAAVARRASSRSTCCCAACPRPRFDPVEEPGVRGAGVAGVVERRPRGGASPSSTRRLGRGRERGPAAVPRRRRPLPARVSRWRCRPCRRCGAATPTTGPGRRRPIPTRFVLHDTDPAVPRPRWSAPSSTDAGAGRLARPHRRPARALRRPGGGRRWPPRRGSPTAAPDRARRVAAHAGGARRRPDRRSLPGGHAACSTAAARPPARPGGTAKDVWVLDPARPSSGRARASAPPFPQVDLRRSLPDRDRPRPCTGRAATPSGPRWPPGPRSSP